MYNLSGRRQLGEGDDVGRSDAPEVDFVSTETECEKPICTAPVIANASLAHPSLAPEVILVVAAQCLTGLLGHRWFCWRWSDALAHEPGYEAPDNENDVLLGVATTLGTLNQIGSEIWCQLVWRYPMLFHESAERADRTAINKDR
jgi:hypothetical protein